MSKEINSELNEARVLLKEERLEKDILICYNKMFSSIYTKKTLLHEVRFFLYMISFLTQPPVF